MIKSQVRKKVEKLKKKAKKKKTKALFIIRAKHYLMNEIWQKRKRSATCYFNDVINLAYYAIQRAEWWNKTLKENKLNGSLSQLIDVMHDLYVQQKKKKERCAKLSVSLKPSDKMIGIIGKELSSALNKLAASSYAANMIVNQMKGALFME